jgi:hypothetical protein
MLIALTILLFSGGSTDIWLFPEDFTDRVEAIIVEENRQTEILELFEKMNESFTIHNDRIKEMAGNISELNRNPNTAAGDFEQDVQSLLQERKLLQTNILNARMKMALQLQQNEWGQIFLTDSVNINNY